MSQASWAANDKHDFTKALQTKRNIFYWSLALFILAALIVTTISSLKICTEQCKEGSLYRMWGYSFELWGFALLLPTLTFHLLSKRYRWSSWFVTALLASSLGAELWFIYVQHSIIGTWCPVCLTLAAVLLLAAINQQLYLKTILKEREEKAGGFMNYSNSSWLMPMMALFGFIFAFSGLSKHDPLLAAQNEVSQKIAFGTQSSPIEIYLFTDWQCPSCRKIEPAIEKLLPKLEEKGRMTFVDLPIHPETLNFTPYNLSFMVNNKKEYIQLRQALSSLSQTTDEPSEEQVRHLADGAGTSYEPLNYMEISSGMRYFNQLAKQFAVNSTPTLVIVNQETKKGKKLRGGMEINEQSIDQAIEKLK